MSHSEALTTVVLALAVPIAMLVFTLGWLLYEQLYKLINRILGEDRPVPDDDVTRCANPECRQQLRPLASQPDRTPCARCQVAAGGDPFTPVPSGD